jgi:lipopolysaccharide export system permease protein
MRAAGMSVHKVLFPIGVSCLIIALAHFILHESFVVRTTGKLAYWEANNYAVDLGADSGLRTDIRIAQDDEIVSAAGAARQGARVRLNDVSVLSLDANGLAQSIVEAPTAIFEEGEWRFERAQKLDVQSLTPLSVEDSNWETTLRPDQIFAMSINPDQTGLFELAGQIGELGQNAAERRSATTSFLSRFSKPMSTLVMPLLGAIAGFGVSRSGSQLVRAAAGASLGFAYFVAENLMIALGKLGAVPAVFGAFFAFAFFVLVGVAILLTMED